MGRNHFGSHKRFLPATAPMPEVKPVVVAKPVARLPFAPGSIAWTLLGRVVPSNAVGAPSGSIKGMW